MWLWSKAKKNRDGSEREHSVVKFLSRFKASASKLEAPPPAESSCPVCQAIAEAVTKGDQLVSLGDWEGFQCRVDCETCQQVVRYFEIEHRPINVRSLSPSCPVALVRDFFWLFSNKLCKFSLYFCKPFA
jgi:hypothetical protein